MRGIMWRAGKSCHDCHGDMNTMASSLLAGRQGWLDMPKCVKLFFGMMIGVPTGTSRAGQSRVVTTVRCSRGGEVNTASVFPAAHFTVKLSPHPHSPVAFGLWNL